MPSMQTVKPILDYFSKPTSIRFVVLNPTERTQPDKGYEWLILSGLFSHVNLTESNIIVWHVDGSVPHIFQIPAATANGYKALWSAADDHPCSYFLIMTDQMYMTFGGGTGASITLTILERKT